MSNKRIFITGGASGLGRALGERYARAGYRVCIGDLDRPRCDDALEAIGRHAPAAHALACDVRSEDDLAAAAAWLEESWGGVDIVVNNAGVAQVGALDQTSIEDWQWIVDINLLGVVRGTKAFLPLLRDSSGHVVNIASAAGLMHLPNMGSYNATKAAVVAFSETMAQELEPDGITVSVVCPAFFKTSLHENMRGEKAGKKLTEKLVGRSEITADEIADRVFVGVGQGKMHVLTHPSTRWTWRVKRVLPYRAFHRLMRREAERMREWMERNS